MLTVIAYIRKYFTEHDTAMSKELAVIPLDKESGPFPAKGYSGARWHGPNCGYPHLWWQGH